MLSDVLAVADRQHTLVTHTQLIRLGMTPEAIRHRVRTGRLYVIRRGIYAVGSPRISIKGHWMAAVLACGPGAALSHDHAGALYGIRPTRRGLIHVSVPAARNPRPDGVIVHRRAYLTEREITEHDHIPVTSPVLTLVDLARHLTVPELERAINEADKLNLVDPQRLREQLETYARHPGVDALRKLLDRHIFILTDSELERLFIPIARRAGLPPPLTGEMVAGFEVDFWWPDLKLVVETDGLTYHRTPTQQTRDRRRDQVHTAAGLTVLRFTHVQVKHEPRYVEKTLAMVAKRLAAGLAA